MKDYKVLKFLDRFKGLFKKFDIDYEAMRKILQVKLLLDSRRVATVLQNNNSKNDDKKDKNNFISSLWIYLLLGLVMIPLVLIGESYIFQMSIVFGIFMFFMITSLISDFSSVLLDLRDKEILLSRPINSRTLNMAKVLHIFFYVSMISMALMGPSLIASLMKKGFLFFILLLAEIILVDLFLIVFTGLIYMLILRFFDGEKLKDIINYVQIGLTIIISLGYQLIGRLFNFIDIDKIQFSGKWWSYIIPPIWFAAPFELILNNNRQINIIAYSLMALIIPITSIIVYIKLMPEFERNLQKLRNVGMAKKSRSKFSDIMGKIACRTKEERNFYRFSTNMIKNEREFKLKVYPNIGFGFIFPFIMLFSLSVGSKFSEVRDSKLYYNIYFILFAVTAMVQFLDRSGNYKGAWIYQTLPIDYPEYIYRGAVKAVFINLFTPLYILVSIIFLIIFRIRIIPHIIAAYLSMMLATSIIFKINNKDLPFSKAFSVTEKGGLLPAFLSLIIEGALFAAHYFVAKASYGVYIYIIMVLIANGITWKYFFRVQGNH